jgi:hypothetical protein
MTCCPCLLPYDAAGGDSIFYLSPYPARHIVRINLFQAVHAGKGRQVLCLRTGKVQIFQRRRKGRQFSVFKNASGKRKPGKPRHEGQERIIRYSGP